MAGSFPTGLGSAWSLGGSLLTFLFPMCLFIVVATVLYLQCWRPHKVPGHTGFAHSAAEPPEASAPPAAGPSGPQATAAGPDRE